MALGWSSLAAAEVCMSKHQIASVNYEDLVHGQSNCGLLHIRAPLKMSTSACVEMLCMCMLYAGHHVPALFLQQSVSTRHASMLHLAIVYRLFSMGLSWKQSLSLCE